MLSEAIAWAGLLWYITLQSVIATGCVQLYIYYRNAHSPSVVESFPLHDVPHITAIRPLKGLEPYLYECLAATFHLTYPREKLTVHFCVSSRDDPAVPIVERLLRDYPHFDAKLFVEDEDDFLQSHSNIYGPNPKIRNMSRAYREAKGDHIWIIDCNVWVGKGVAGRMVDTIEGFRCGTSGRKYKLVHQLPLVIDVTNEQSEDSNRHMLPQAASTSTSATSMIQPRHRAQGSRIGFVSSLYGGRLEELFLSSAHAKMYTAINTVLIAPCIVGKSNMFRRSHLNALTRDSPDFRPQGIDYFSYNICEDHLIGDLLWKQDVPEEVETGKKYGRHALVFGDLAIQPMAGMSVKEYIARRIRWLRVRKFTVTAATLVEPGTESMLSSLFGAYGITTSSWVHETLSVPQTWTAFGTFWFVSICVWIATDWAMYRILHSMASIEEDADTPQFAQRQPGSRRPFWEWLLAWLGRETLALPIWIVAVWGGVTVKWRGQRFRVGIDMRVHALDAAASSRRDPLGVSGPDRALSRTPDRSKARRE